MSNLIGKFADFLDALDEEVEEIEGGVEEEYVDEADFDRDIAHDDGVVLSINMEKLDKRTEDDMFLSDEEECPKCHGCGKSIPLPCYIWHGRTYCRKCALRRDIMLSELHPSVYRITKPVGVLVLKNGSKILFLWDRDVTNELRRYRKKGKYVTVWDFDQGKVSVHPEDVLVVKKPRDLYHKRWTNPVPPVVEDDEDE